MWVVLWCAQSIVPDSQSQMPLALINLFSLGVKWCSHEFGHIGELEMPIFLHPVHFVNVDDLNRVPCENAFHSWDETCTAREGEGNRREQWLYSATRKFIIMFLQFCNITFHHDCFFLKIKNISILLCYPFHSTENKWIKPMAIYKVIQQFSSILCGLSLH